MPFPTLAEREKGIENFRGCARLENFAWPAAVIFVLLGIIGDAADVTIGLHSITWLLLSIGAMLAAIFFRIGAGIFLNAR